jgi:hypothetical protein
MSIKYTNIFHCKTLLVNVPKLVLKQTVWQPWCGLFYIHLVSLCLGCLIFIMSPEFQHSKDVEVDFGTHVGALRRVVGIQQLPFQRSVRCQMFKNNGTPALLEMLHL